MKPTAAAIVDLGDRGTNNSLAQMQVTNSSQTRASAQSTNHWYGKTGQNSLSLRCTATNSQISSMWVTDQR